jgi:hypothetical protein
MENELSVNPFTERLFSLQVKDEKGQLVDCKTRLYDPKVSKRRKLDRVLKELIRMNRINECRVGRLQVRLFLAHDVLKAVQQLQERGISCYE